MSYAIGKRMGLGSPGTVSRGAAGTVIVSRVTASDIPFGAATYLLPDNTIADSGGLFIGFSARVVKHQMPFETDGFYHAGEIADIVTAGTVIVKADEAAGQPEAGGQVYITANGAAAAGGQVLPGARFTTGAIDNGIVEVTLTERGI